jgi:hypothetical protein
MSEPWFNPETFGPWFGAIGGGVGGSLLGCLGALAGLLIPKGRGRAVVLGGFALFLVIGVALAAFGVVALVAGQPYAIWYEPLLMGLLMAGLCGVFLPMCRSFYAQAERRRMDAESLRNS